MAEMRAMTYNYLQGQVNRLKTENKLAYTELITYVLNPYITGLKYDIYDFEQVRLDFDNGTVQVNVAPDIRITFALDRDAEYSLIDEKDKIFVYFDTHSSSLSLRFKVLDQWSDVESVKFLDIAKEDAQKNAADLKKENDKFVRINSYVTKPNLLGQYKEKQERFFTEVVVDGLLAEGEWNNDFVRQSLANELKNPSEEMVRILANRLVADYTTQNVDKVAEQLTPIIKEGLSGIVDYIVAQGMLPTSNYGYSPTYTKPEPKAPAKLDEKPKVTEKELSSLEKEFGDVGLSFDKSETTKPVEETFNLEDTLVKETAEPELSDDGSLSLDNLL